MYSADSLLHACVQILFFHRVSEHWRGVCVRVTFEVMLKNEFPEVKLLVLITLEYDTTLYSDNLGQIACG